MANLNKVLLIGRLTRDPESIANGNGAKFGFAVNNRKYNKDADKWEDVAVFIDCEVWNRGDEGTQATRVLETLGKGKQIFIEGRLKFEQWTSSDGAKRSALRVVVEMFQYLDPKEGGDGGGNGAQTRPAPRQAQRGTAPAANDYPADDDDFSRQPGGHDGSENDIPF